MSHPPTPIVAHILRPAQGGMRELVRTLLRAAPENAAPLLVAPADLLDTLADAVPDASRRAVFRAESAAPHHQIAGGQTAGRWAKERGASVLHGHGLRYAPAFAAASVACGLPLVVSLHNLVPDDLNGLQKAAARAALLRAAAVIAVSGAVAKSAASVVDTERIVTIPNGIDAARFTVPSVERLARRIACRESLGVAATETLIVCVSRLSPEKDVTNLIEAFALVAARFPGARLAIAGDGKARQTLQWHTELLALQNRVTFLGATPRDQIADLLFAGEIFALSSREEGLSLAVLEAMVAGLPIVATNVGGLPEAIAVGATGLLAPPRDPAAFADALSELLSDPAKRERFGNAGRLRVLDRFTDSRMVAETFAVHSRVARR